MEMWNQKKAIESAIVAVIAIGGSTLLMKVGLIQKVLVNFPEVIGISTGVVLAAAVAVYAYHVIKG